MYSSLCSFYDETGITVRVIELATPLNLVSVVEFAGTVTVLTAPDLPGTKFVTVAMFGAMKVMSKSLSAVHPVKQASTVVMPAQVLNRSDGIDASLVAFDHADLKLVMFGQLARSPDGIAVNAEQFSKHCCNVVMPVQDSNVDASMVAILLQVENVDSKFVASGVYANRDAGSACSLEHFFQEDQNAVTRGELAKSPAPIV